MLTDEQVETFVDHDICKRCQCCSTEWMECWSCDEGFFGHDCGEDCCCCLEPENNELCDICNGQGGWRACLGRCSSEDSGHAPLSLPEGIPNAD